MYALFTESPQSKLLSISSQKLVAVTLHVLVLISFEPIFTIGDGQ